MDLNVIGTFNTIKASALRMKEPGGGSIVGISSISGLLTIPSMPAYCTSKAALEMLLKCAADELGVFNIRVNGIRPGIVSSEIMERFLIPIHDVVEDYKANMPISRIGTPDEIAAVVHFLVGPNSSWITGQILSVDGGHSLRRGPNHEGLVRPSIGEERWRFVRESSSHPRDRTQTAPTHSAREKTSDLNQ